MVMKLGGRGSDARADGHHLQLKTTKVGLGAIATNRIQKGMVYVTSAGNIGHTTLRCPSPYDSTTMLHVPLFEIDGELKISFEGGEYVTPLCERCPTDLPTDFMNDGACVGTDKDMLTPVKDEQTDLIAEFCNVCPVVVECLEYGANNIDNIGIWGGVYLSPVKAAREAALAT